MSPTPWLSLILFLSYLQNVGQSSFTQLYDIETLEVSVPEVVEAVDSEDEDSSVSGDRNVILATMGIGMAHLIRVTPL